MDSLLQAVAIVLPSGEAAAKHGPIGGSCVAVKRRPLATFHSLISLKSPAIANEPLSGENASAVGRS
jgi:hypothetical protein